MAAAPQAVITGIGTSATPLAMVPGSGLGSAWGRPTVSDLDLDAQLVDRCLQGDEGAWEDLVKAHTRRVYAICYRFTGKDSEAQDLTQDVFLRVFKSVKSFRAGEGSFAVWLTRLTRNLLIDRLPGGPRWSGRRTRFEEQLPMLEEKTALESRTDAILAGREASEALQSALAKLSPELRETVILRDLQELEYREVAEILGMPEER
ncbi:MAG: RNA polymerase sigma factor [Paludibaculum sp.]